MGNQRQNKFADGRPNHYHPPKPIQVPMPDSDAKSVFDAEPDADHEARLDAEAEADYAAGRVISHERMCEWLAKLAKGQKVPPPAVG
jgi:hypothetical protein